MEGRDTGAHKHAHTRPVNLFWPNGAPLLGAVIIYDLSVDVWTRCHAPLHGTQLELAVGSKKTATNFAAKQTCAF